MSSSKATKRSRSKVTAILQSSAPLSTMKSCGGGGAPHRRKSSVNAEWITFVFEKFLLHSRMFLKLSMKDGTDPQWLGGGRQYLAVEPSGQLGLDDHHDDAEHPADQGVVAQLLALPEESLPLAQPVADVLALLLRRGAFLSGLALAGGLAGVLPDDLGEGVLQDGAVQQLQRLLTRVQIRQTGPQVMLVAARRAHRVPVGDVHGVRGGAGRWRKVFGEGESGSAEELRVRLQRKDSINHTGS
ncbi:hypothetical protein EYF80_057414 [Liparis tanakae]|uniref:Uncharacterized protein n=1 Tax=Liparis tanakae TaxID=230148 RepID=A0A4Z2EU97_9TELE|nr:hypothetical protein EYF80_057414 [Liparis tanakae]